MVRHAVCLALASLLLGDATAYAQSVVLGPCKDRSGTALGKDARKRLTAAFIERGVKVMPWVEYRNAAGKRRLAPKKALTSRGIKKTARAIGLNGVVKSEVRLSAGRLTITFHLFGQNGRMLLSKPYKVKKASFPEEWANQLAGLMIEKLGPPATLPVDAAPEKESEIALVPLLSVDPSPQVKDAKPELAEVAGSPPTPEAPTKTVKPTVPAEADPVGLDLGDEESSRAPVADAEDSGSEAPTPEQKQQWDEILKLADQPEGQSDRQERAAAAEAEAAAVAERPSDLEEGTASSARASASRRAAPGDGRSSSAPDVSLTMGLSINTRGGLSPRHEAGAFPGIRIDARVFMAPMIDVPVIRNIGLEATFNKSLGLKAEPELFDDSWDASQLQFNAGLAYRLGLDSASLAPAFLFRFGYGATSYAIEYDHPDVLDASYTYTYGALDVHLMLVPSLLGAQLTVGYLFDVWPSDTLSGNGSGVVFGAGLSLELFGGLHAGLGYEQVQFLFDDRDLGTTSDRFQMFYLRAGWSHR